jgi:Protein of unknown function (DUF3147)
MRVRLDTSALRQTEWHQYAIRFVFGGLITAAAGMIAMQYGPVIGGLFLAFPAIFPAGATLIEKHEKVKKQKVGMRGMVRGRQAASVDAAGAAMGSVGLFIFALLVWEFISNHRAWMALLVATAAWLVVSVLLWQIRKRASTMRRKTHTGFKVNHVER